MKRITSAITQLCHSLLFFPVAITLRILNKRKDSIVLVIGRDNGKLLDNCKYVLPELQKLNTNGVSAYYVTTNLDTFNQLSNMGIKCHLKKIGLDSFLLFVQAGVIIIDSLDWSKNGWHLFFSGAHTIQLWHGIPLKEIEVKKANRAIENKGLLLKIIFICYWKLTNRFITFRALIATSEKSEHLLSRCINNIECWITGYARNDVLLKDSPSEFDYLNVDQDASKEIKDLKILNRKIIFYCPTFRDGMENPLNENIHIANAINKFLLKKNVHLFIKFHPWIKDKINLKELTNIKIIKSDSDIYPLLRQADLLITDYSSIYFDFLLLDKPIIFFPYDFESYKENERELLLDYETFTPGNKCYTLRALMRTISHELIIENDEYSDDRRIVRNLMFMHQDEKSAERIVEKICWSLLK